MCIWESKQKNIEFSYKSKQENRFFSNVELTEELIAWYRFGQMYSLTDAQSSKILHWEHPVSLVLASRPCFSPPTTLWPISHLREAPSHETVLFFISRQCPFHPLNTSVLLTNPAGEYLVMLGFLAV